MADPEGIDDLIRTVITEVDGLTDPFTLQGILDRIEDLPVDGELFRALTQLALDRSALRVAASVGVVIRANTAPPAPRGLAHILSQKCLAAHLTVSHDIRAALSAHEATRQDFEVLRVGGRGRFDARDPLASRAAEVQRQRAPTVTDAMSVIGLARSVSSAGDAAVLAEKVDALAASDLAADAITLVLQTVSAELQVQLVAGYGGLWATRDAGVRYPTTPPSLEVMSAIEPLVHKMAAGTRSVPLSREYWIYCQRVIPERASGPRLAELPAAPARIERAFAGGSQVF